MQFAIVVFPGSNCDHDAYHAAKHVLGQDATFVWHKETSLGAADVVILPGGFSHGDYLRTGAIARFSPIMTAVICASGARSPDAPTDPCCGTSGYMPRASMAWSCSMISRRTPEAPRPNEMIFNAIINRTIGSGVGAPTPQQCDTMRLRCSSVVCSGGIRFDDSFPNPVLMP